MSDALKQLAASAEPLYVVVVADDGGGWGDGQPIVWETQISAGSTLDAAKARQQQIGDRYGATYIAECRILPATLREPRQ